MASSSYEAANDNVGADDAGPTSAAAADVDLSGESWDPQIIAAGGTPSKQVGPGGMINVSPRSDSYREQQRRKTFGRRGQQSQHRHITSEAAPGNGNDVHAQAAALSAAGGGPAAPSAQVGVEVSPSKSRDYGDDAAEDEDDDDSLLRGAAAGSAEEAAAAERAALREHELRAQSNPVLACVDGASVMFREKMNCEYFEERQPTPRKQRPGGAGAGAGALDTSTGSASSSRGGRVVTVGGQTAMTQSKTLSPPSARGGVASPVRDIIQESEQRADRPSPHSARKSKAFFSQFDVSDVKSSSTDAADDNAGVEGGGGNAGESAATGRVVGDYGADEDDMPDDELNESRSRSRSNSAARDGPSPSNDAGSGSGGAIPPAPAADGRRDKNEAEEEEEDIIASITRTISEMCASPTSGAAAAGAAGAAGAGAVVATSGRAREGGSDGQEEADMPPNENGLDVDICTYLQNICGVPTLGGDEPPPPPPPPPPADGSSPSRSPGSGVRAIAIGGAAVAGGVGAAAAATAASRGDNDDEEGLSTSINGKAAQLDLSGTRGRGGGGTDQQENTAIEVEYVDPDYYSSDEDDDEDYEHNHRGAAAAGGAAAAVAARKSKSKKDKKKKGGLGKGLSKMFGKSKSKKGGPHDDEEKKDDVDPAKIAATAAAAAAAAGTAAALATQGDEAGTLTDEDESQGTADHVGDADGVEAEVVRAPEAGQEPFDETGKPSGSEGWTVDEKNAHLQAMASKARDDYMYGKGSPPPSPGRGAAEADGTPDDSSVPEDDYADWRPSEKRRFLQLLSQGMSPREAARNIKNARRGIEPGVSASPSAEAADSSEDVRVDEAAEESEAVGDNADDDEEPVEGDDDDNSRMAAAAAAVAAGATAVTAAGVAAVVSKTAADEETPANILGETGVGYYDGVKRDENDAAAENIVDISAMQSPPQDAASVKSTKRSILPVSLKSKGFASLDSDMNSPDDRRKRGNIKALFAGGKNKTTKDGFATLDSDSENELEDNFEGERSVAASKATGANDDDTIFDFNDDKTVEAGGVGAAGTPRSPQPDTIPEDNVEPIPSSEMSVVSGVTMNTEYTDNMTVGTAYTNATTKSTRRRHHGAAKKRLNKAKEAEDGKSVGWLDSIRTAAANNNRVWDPQLGWVDYEEPEKGDEGSSANHIGPLHLPVKARDAQHGDRGIDADDSGLHAIEEGDATEVPNGPGATSRAAYGVAAVGATAATAAVASNMANRQGQQDDATVTSALTENTSRSAVTDRQGAPKGWVESMKAASERVSASDPNRRWDPQHGWIGLPPGAMPPTEDKEEDVQTQETTDAVPETKGGALNTSMISERSAGPVDLDDSDIDDDDDDDESVEEEKEELQAMPEEPPEEESVVSRRIRPDPSGLLEDSEDATLASGMLSADGTVPTSDSGAKKPFIKLPAPRMGRGRGAAQQGYDEIASVASENRPQSPETGDEEDVIVKTSSQTSYEQFQWEEANAAGAPVAAAAAVGAAAAVAASSLPPKVPKKDRPDSAEKSAPEVQVVKLKMNDKDKDLFLNSKDDSDHFIDDTNFAPEFADESPFSTPSRVAAAARGGIEVNGDDIGLDTTQSDIVRSSPKSEVVESDAGIVSSKTSRDPPQNAAEGVDGASAAPSVSSRAKQWMDLMESKSKKNVGVAGGAADTKSEASSAIDWPASGSSARKAQSKGGEEWKSFLGKKGSTGVPTQQPGQAGGADNALKFAAADGGSEADFKSDTGAPSTARGGLARAPTDDDDTLFKFDETSQMGETNPLKAKLQNMNSARAMPGVTEASETTASSDGDPSSTGGDPKGGKKSIFKRLTECAAPVLPEGCANPTVVDDTGKEVPVSHLEFLKKSKVAGSLREIAPSTLCGRPDTIYEEGPDGRRKATKKSASASSVVSGDGFGAKNAYLDAVALKTATRGRSSSTGRPSSRGRSSSSQRSGTSQRSSESWQGFLERRSASKSPGPSRPPTSPPVTNVSAEQKAAQKVEEMMKAMAMNTKSKADIDDMIETMSQASSPSKAPTAIGYDQIEMTRSNISSFSQNKKKSESAIAAEELAAARVEAMMKAMSSQKLDGDV